MFTRHNQYHPDPNLPPPGLPILFSRFLTPSFLHWFPNARQPAPTLSGKLKFARVHSNLAWEASVTLWVGFCVEDLGPSDLKYSGT